MYQDIESMDARGNVTHMILGNGIDAHASYEAVSGRLETLTAYKGGVQVQDHDYLFDVLGKLKQRWDRSGSKDLKEDFTYDSLNRLSTVKLTAPDFGLSSFQTLSLSYNDAGNITHKSDVGTYSYGAGNAGPHAVTSAGGQSYSYDANGNMISGDGRSISYTIFDKASQITQGGNTVDFYYDMNRNRYQRVEGSKTTTYVGNVEIIDTPTELEYRRSIAGVAIQHLFPNSQTYREEYLLKDHLGSIDIITDESGEVITDGFLNPIGELSFDAFGQRRQASDWRLTIQGSNPVPQSTTRGYTGHEMVDSVNVIHMNGRIYDPKLGRFMQADPHVQAPENAQNLNRYSYVLNNPLSYTDPSGFFFSKLKKFLRPLAAIAISIWLPGSSFIWGSLASGFTATVATGFIAGYVATGNIKGALIGAFSAALFYGIGDAFANNPDAAGNFFGTDLNAGAFFGKTAAHGIAGGVMSSLQGGRFGHGFLSAGVTQAFSGKIGSIKSDSGRVFASAALGGTVSRLTGGKFANGAVTAAFSRAFNDERHGNGLSRWWRDFKAGGGMLASDVWNGEWDKIGDFAIEEGPGILLREASIIGGAGQIVLGGAICYGSGGLACTGGVGIAGHGVNNIYEGFSGSDGFIRDGYQAVLGDTYGNIAYGAVDIGISGYAAFKPTVIPGGPVPGSPGITRMDRTVPSIRAAGGIEILRDVYTTAPAVKDVFGNDGQ